MKFYSHKFFFLLFSLNFLSFYLFISCGEPNSRKDKGQDLIETKRLNEQKVWEASSELFRKITKRKLMKTLICQRFNLIKVDHIHNI
jgi:hypothetical protein